MDSKDRQNDYSHQQLFGIWHENKKKTPNLNVLDANMLACHVFGAVFSGKVTKISQKSHPCDSYSACYQK